MQSFSASCFILECAYSPHQVYPLSYRLDECLHLVVLRLFTYSVVNPKDCVCWILFFFLLELFPKQLDQFFKSRWYSKRVSTAVSVIKLDNKQSLPRWFVQGHHQNYTFLEVAFAMMGDRASVPFLEGDSSSFARIFCNASSRRAPVAAVGATGPSPAAVRWTKWTTIRSYHVGLEKATTENLMYIVLLDQPLWQWLVTRPLVACVTLLIATLVVVPVWRRFALVAALLSSFHLARMVCATHGGHCLPAYPQLEKANSSPPCFCQNDPHEKTKEPMSHP